VKVVTPPEKLAEMLPVGITPEVVLLVSTSCEAV